MRGFFKIAFAVLAIVIQFSAGGSAALAFLPDSASTACGNAKAISSASIHERYRLDRAEIRLCCIWPRTFFFQLNIQASAW